jgi:hypothetical protein
MGSPLVSIAVTTCNDKGEIPHKTRMGGVEGRWVPHFFGPFVDKKVHSNQEMTGLYG